MKHTKHEKAKRPRVDMCCACFATAPVVEGMCNACWRIHKRALKWMRGSRADDTVPAPVIKAARWPVKDIWKQQ